MTVYLYVCLNICYNNMLYLSLCSRSCSCNPIFFFRWTLPLHPDKVSRISQWCVLLPIDFEDVPMQVFLPTYLNSCREVLGVPRQVSVRIGGLWGRWDRLGGLLAQFFHECVVNLLNLWMLDCKDFKLGSILSA